MLAEKGRFISLKEESLIVTAATLTIAPVAGSFAACDHYCPAK